MTQWLVRNKKRLGEILQLQVDKGKMRDKRFPGVPFPLPMPDNDTATITLRGPIPDYVGPSCEVVQDDGTLIGKFFISTAAPGMLGECYLTGMWQYPE